MSNQDEERYTFEGGQQIKDGRLRTITLFVCFMILMPIIMLVNPDSQPISERIGIIIFIDGLLGFLLLLALFSSKRFKENPPVITINEDIITITGAFWRCEKDNNQLILNRNNIVEVIPKVEWRANEEYIKKYKAGEVMFYDQEKFSNYRLSLVPQTDRDVLYRTLNRCFIIIDNQGTHYLISRDFERLGHLVQVLLPSKNTNIKMGDS